MWIAAGGWLIRAHEGSCFVYHPSGAFQVFRGVPPENLLFAVKETLIMTEGLLRLIPVGVKRDDDSILNAIHGLIFKKDGDADVHGLSIACGNAALVHQRDTRNGDEDDEADQQVFQNPCHASSFMLQVGRWDAKRGTGFIMCECH